MSDGAARPRPRPRPRPQSFGLGLFFRGWLRHVHHHTFIVIVLQGLLGVYLLGVILNRQHAKAFIFAYVIIEDVGQGFVGQVWLNRNPGEQKLVVLDSLLAGHAGG